MKLEFLCESPPKPGSFRHRMRARGDVAWALYIDEDFEVARGKSKTVEAAKEDAERAWWAFQAKVARTILPDPMEWN